MKRASERAARTTAPFVEPTSVTVPLDASSTSATDAASRATGAATTVSSDVADRLRERAGSLDRAALDRARERLLVGVVAAHVLDSRAPGGESDGGADQAGADDCE